jgi:AcrR family transcriptional regulator
MASTPTLRDVRERELVRATRALFDARGTLEAPVEEIARAVGIARGLIYRQFASKEELYVLTVTDYLDELATGLEAVGDGDPVERLEGCAREFAAFCRRYPAYTEAALSLLRRPARELQAAVSESVWLRLGAGMVRCIGTLADILRSDAFDVERPDYTANLLWTQTLGAMHLARIGVGVRRLQTGEPELFGIDPEEVVRSVVDAGLTVVGARRPRR